MNDRIDLNFVGGSVTRKNMSNGEWRTRMRLERGIDTTITEMPVWNWEDGIPWQNAHTHKSHRETYFVISGWMIMGKLHPDSRDASAPRYHGVIMTEYTHSSMSFSPGEAHTVLLGPGAIIQTTRVDCHVEKSDRDSQDWYPCEQLDCWVKRWSAPEIKRGLFDEGIRTGESTWSLPRS